LFGLKERKKERTLLIIVWSEESYEYSGLGFMIHLIFSLWNMNREKRIGSFHEKGYMGISQKERIVAIIERESQMNRKMNESLVREGIEEVLK